MSLLRTAAKGMAWTTASTMIRSIVSMLQVAILTRYLSKADFGIVAIATLFIGFSQIFLDMGISIGIMHKQDITKCQYSSLFWLNIISGVLLTLILMAISPLVANFYEEPSLTSILILLSTTMFFSAIGNQHRIVQQKKLRFKIISIVEIITSILTLIVAVITCISGWRIYSLVFSTIFNAAFLNITFLCVGLRRDDNISFAFKLKETLPFLKIGIYSLGSQLIDYLNREMDVIIISSILGKEVLGIYSLCKRLILALYSAVNPILMKVLTPLLANMQEDVKKLQRIYYDIVETLAFVNFPIYCFVAIFSYAILNLIYGSNYTEGCHVLSLLALHYGFLTTGNPVGALQTALGRTDSGFYWTICRIPLYTLATYIGALFSIEGIVICLLLISILSSPLSWRITIRPLIGGKFLQFFLLSFKPFIATLIYSLGFYFFFYNQTYIYYCILGGLIYLLFYGVLFILFERQTYLGRIIINVISKIKS